MRFVFPVLKSLTSLLETRHSSVSQSGHTARYLVTSCHLCGQAKVVHGASKGLRGTRHGSTLANQESDPGGDVRNRSASTDGSPHSLFEPVTPTSSSYFRKLVEPQPERGKKKYDWGNYVDPSVGVRSETRNASNSAWFGEEDDSSMESSSQARGGGFREKLEKVQDPNSMKPDLVAQFKPQMLPDISSGLADDLDDINWEEVEKNDPERRPLETVSDTDPSLNDVALAPKPFAYNLAAFANDNSNVRKLSDLGVELWRYDQDTEMSQHVVTGDWDSKIQPHLDFLKEIGMKDEDVPAILSKWPRILKHSVADLDAKIGYFKSKKFADIAIVRILKKAPLAFSLSVAHVDKRLGDLQKTFRLQGEEVRIVVTKVPKIVVRSPHELVKLKLSLIHEMGFTLEETRHMLITQPKILLLDKHHLMERFEYLHNVVNMSHRQILEFPGALRMREYEMKERHLFLKSLGMNQYDKTQPNYVSLHALCSDKDVNFCKNVAKQSVQMFNSFKKTL